MKKEVKLVLKDEKKHSVRYEDREGDFGVFYIPKSELPEKFPKEMTMTLEWEE